MHYKCVHVVKKTEFNVVKMYRNLSQIQEEIPTNIQPVKFYCEINKSWLISHKIYKIDKYTTRQNCPSNKTNDILFQKYRISKINTKYNQSKFHVKKSMLINTQFIYN